MDALQSLSDHTDNDDRRSHPRHPVSWVGEVRVGERVFPCTALDISPAGAKLRIPEPIGIGAPVKIDLKGKGLYLGSVKWLDADLVGIGFPRTPARHALRERLTSRHETSWQGCISSAHGTTKCRILNLSSRGARILMAEPIRHDTLLSLLVDSFGEVRGQIAWQIHELLGIAFFEPESELVQRLISDMPSQPSGA